ncbi:MAG TPA: hypothetical protein PLW99_03035 [Candidatus Paceibacterota bacterium]|nr:hypothetical protein [Candidatus Paceibacterota bacterium]
MTTPQLTAYIRAQLAAGASRTMVRKALLLNEWTDRDIDAAFAEMSPAPARAATLTAPPSLALRKFILSAGFIVISVAYAAWQSVGGQSITIQNTAATTPAQSYKAANDALLQTLAQIPAATAPAPTQPAAPATPAPQPATPAPTASGCCCRRPS